MRPIPKAIALGALFLSFFALTILAVGYSFDESEDYGDEGEGEEGGFGGYEVIDVSDERPLYEVVDLKTGKTDLICNFKLDEELEEQTIEELVSTFGSPPLLFRQNKGAFLDHGMIGSFDQLDDSKALIVQDTTIFPYNTIALLDIYPELDHYLFYDSKEIYGTGFFFYNSRIVVTAGHLLFAIPYELRVEAYIHPGHTIKLGETTPVFATGKSGKFCANPNAPNQDWGFIIVDDPPAGWIPSGTMSILTHEDLERDGEDPNQWFIEDYAFFTTAGYPGECDCDKDYAHYLAMYKDGALCTSANYFRLYFDFNFCITKDCKGRCCHGQSGSPVWTYYKGARQIVGILSTSNCGSTKMHDEYVDDMSVFTR